jgi:DNA-binding PadR family transcriptional regulator
MSVGLALLGILHERDFHGYELKKTIERRMGMWADIKFGSIYHALLQLERSGFVRRVKAGPTPSKPRARAVFSITPAGRGEFRKLLTENILVLKRVFLKDDLGVYFSNYLKAAEFKELLGQHILSLENILGTLIAHRERMAEYAPERVNIAWWMVTRHIEHLRTDLNWFRQLLQGLVAGNL